jgi:hypothetical protein
MPECWWFAKYGYCSAGDECLYAHPKERKIECPDYNRGYCKLGMFMDYNHVFSLLDILRSELSKETHTESCMPTVLNGVLSPWTRMSQRPVSICSYLFQCITLKLLRVRNQTSLRPKHTNCQTLLQKI